MNTKVNIVNDNNKEESLSEAAKVIQNGGIVAFPTETVYGLGANALDEEAVKKIFIAKGRPQDNPLIVHVASKDITNLVEEVPQIAQKLMNKFWPGPLTIILKKKKGVIPKVTCANLESVGIRMPNNDIALELIKRSGHPIAAPSANISGRPSPTDVERCIEDLNGRVDYILGGDKCNVGVESTILDCTVNPPVVLRPGGITVEQLKEFDDEIEIDAGIIKNDSNIKPKAPGMKYRHYAPKAKVRIISGDMEKVTLEMKKMLNEYKKQGKKVGILTTEENVNKYDNDIILSLGNKLDEVARNLFESLRALDDKGVDVILSEGFCEEGIGVAIMNRLKKAAGYDVINV